MPNSTTVHKVWSLRHKARTMGAADFLFTPSVQRVLAATLAQPERAYMLQELLTLANSGRGSTQLQIERLLAFGILREEPRRGRHRSIRANAEHFLYPELRSILLKTAALVEPLRDTLRPFATRIEEAFVFGSVARGTDTQNSDIDLAVVGYVSLFELSEPLQIAEQTFGRAVHLSLYDPREWRELASCDSAAGRISQGPRLQVMPDNQPSGTDAT